MSKRKRNCRSFFISRIPWIKIYFQVKKSVFEHSYLPTVMGIASSSTSGKGLVSQIHNDVAQCDCKPGKRTERYRRQKREKERAREWRTEIVCGKLLSTESRRLVCIERQLNGVARIRKLVWKRRGNPASTLNKLSHPTPPSFPVSSTLQVLHNLPDTETHRNFSAKFKNRYVARVK